MRALTAAALSLLVLCCLAACGGDDVADDPKLSEEGKEVVQSVGGPFDAAEFKKFLKVLPEISGLTAQHAGNGSGAGMSAAVKDAIKARGWDENRFLYIYAHAMVMANYEKMQGMTARLQDQFKDLPEDQRKAMEQMMSQQVDGQVDAFKAEVDKQVPASEQAVIRDNMQALMTAVGMR